MPASARASGCRARARRLQRAVLARDLDEVPLLELYEHCQLRVPVDDSPLPGRDDALGQAASQALDDLRLPLRAMLRRRVGDLYKPLSGETP